MIQVVELLRVSTDAQEDRAGLAGQHATNVQTCQRYGLEAVATVEIVESGTTVASSPAMARVLDYVQRGVARGVVLAEYSRLFRPDRWSDFAVLQTLCDNDARIYLPSGPIDLQSELGYVQATVNNLLAAMERRRIRERLDRGKEEHRRRGEHVAGGVGMPLGLAYSPEGWTYTPEVERVRDLFRRFLAGERNFAQLERETGFARSTIRYLLTNPVYAGWRVYDKRRDLTAAGLYENGRDRRKVARLPADVIRIRLPLVPVVSDADFAAVQSTLASMAERRTPRTPSGETFVYRGFVRCAYDDEPLYGVRSIQKQGRVAYNYVCPCRTDKRRGRERCGTGYMRAHRFHAALDAIVAERLTDPALLTEALRAYQDSQGAAWRAGPDPEAVGGQLMALQGQRARVLELYVEGLIDRAERDRRLAPLSSEDAALRKLLDQPARPPEAAIDALCGAVAVTFARWRYLTARERRTLLLAAEPLFYVKRYDVQGVSFPLSRASGSHWTAADPVAPARLYIPLRGVA